METKPPHLKKQTKIKPIHFFIFFVALSTLIAFIVGGILIGKDIAEKEQMQFDEKANEYETNKSNK